MASSDVDQKFLGRIAQATAPQNALLSASLFQLLGISVRLARKVYRARKLRRLDTSRDTKSLNLYHQIIFMSREGLSTLETYVLPYTSEGAYGPEARVLAFKLRASFCHIFCLFHNQPPVSLASVPQSAVPQDSSSSRTRRGDPSSPRDRRRRSASLRDPVASMTSDASFLTNPYAGQPSGTMPTPSPRAPPGLTPVAIPSASSFLLPPYNFVPVASKYFETASAWAQASLPGSHPLRLSVALERAAFSWDCLHDHNEARVLARQAIKDVYRAVEAMSDAEFEDAAELVSVLGRFMKRKSWEATPSATATAIGSPIAAATTNGAPVGPHPVTSGVVPPVPSLVHPVSQVRYSGNGGPVQEPHRTRDSNGADTRSEASGRGNNSPRRSRRGSGGSNHKSRSSKDSKESRESRDSGSKRDAGDSHHASRRRPHHHAPSSRETTPVLPPSDSTPRRGTAPAAAGDTTPNTSSRRDSGDARRRDSGDSRRRDSGDSRRRDSGDSRHRGGNGGSKESTPRLAQAANRSSRESSATITPRTYNLLTRTPRSSGGSTRLSPTSSRR